MEATIQVLNELEKEGVISRYAIGGGVGAIFYIEPFLTYDLDVFVILPVSTGGLLTLGPVYEALQKRGYLAEKECVQVEGVPVQFLPAYNALVEEALSEARSLTYGVTPTRVLQPEHLVGIMLQTGRDKDRERFAAFLRQANLDQERLQDILKRYQLEGVWNQWKG
ncbi:MAG: hypothetical protein HUU16_00630 [Candidatus Omnitrophica bacterium]|nr:hypothetical protein [Candidatus Omnitrophota bacterium]